MRPPTTLRRTAAALLFPLALAPVAACGTDTGDDQPAGSSLAADPGLQAGDEMPLEEFADIVEEAADAATTAHVEGSLVAPDESGNVEVEGDVDFAAASPSARLTTTDGAGDDESELLLVDGVAYVAIPQLGEKYLKIDPGALPGGLSDKLGDLPMDRTDLADAVSRAVSRVTYEGDDEVDGGDAARYTVTLDTSKMADHLGGKGAGQAGQLDIEVWFDEGGLFRQVSTDAGQETGSLSVTFSDWGDDVSIEKPAQDQLMEMPELPSSPGLGQH